MEEQYGIIEAKKPEFEPRRLLKVPHKQGDLVVAYPAFGPACFNTNVAEMQKHYSHPQTGVKISFRPATTAESTSAASYKFSEMAKPQIFDPRWLQAGRIVRTSEGIYANPPKSKDGKPMTDEKTLKSFLNSTKPVRVDNGVIYVVSNTDILRDFGYAEYETFKQGEQDSGDFTEGGLAKLLEHTEHPKNLGEISSAKNYPRGVNVLGFDSLKEPLLRVVGLCSGGDSGSDGLDVDGDDWDDGDDGCAFGVLD